MNFRKKLIPGLFIKRYKRFFVDVKIHNEIITAHCPNTGSMSGLLKKGNKVWLSKSDNPKRKLKYTLEIIKDQNSKVGVNTHLTNKIFFDGLKNKVIKELKGNFEIQPETRYGKNTRFDFLIRNKKTKAFTYPILHISDRLVFGDRTGKYTYAKEYSWAYNNERFYLP